MLCQAPILYYIVTLLVDPIPAKEQLKGGGRLRPGSQFEGTVHHGREDREGAGLPDPVVGLFPMVFPQPWLGNYCV